MRIAMKSAGKILLILFAVLFLFIIITFVSHCVKDKYEIEKVVHDNNFSDILEGKTVPIEIKYGLGGAGGYRQWSTKDPKIINEYIEAFRQIRIKDVITNQDDMVYIFDGIEDYIFILQDGTEIVVGTDCSTYVFDEDIQYVLEKNEKLFELNKLIRED